MDKWSLAFQVLQFLITGVIGFYVHLVTKDKVTNDKIRAIQETQTRVNEEHGSRLSRLESEIGGAPTHEHLSDVYEKINEVAVCVSRLKGEMEGMNRTLSLIHETMMEDRRS
ncbi:MAG: hypothetical protein LBE24_10580 [Methylobacillus sp.]|jgi:GTP1/Obg family GTP-binding protein|nr:hypothetical protein [Methylobacillus sp.]